eukprot:CAMPEP_0176010622 /NCGR_PEP_ID=MMETSP0120_2-20121206/4864_1 /TAXON_ID=160619 /ORGANISM="Kryptoperidinium foliaceum, Strain CCMP 1326" /LENGTH=160 /DNA_ID=CAMNT_0017343461 /DNA_START=13 /DNA_END=492 /DNA_ORIENTATION=-
MTTMVQNFVAREVRAAQLDMEGQMTMLTSRAFAVVKERLAALEFDIANVKVRMDAVELGAKRWTPTSRIPGAGGAFLGSATNVASVGSHTFSLMEDRVASLERSLGKPLDSLPIETSRQLQIMRKELLEECIDRCTVSVERARADFRDTRLRLEELESWL